MLSCVWLFVTHWLQHARSPCPSPIPGVYSSSCPSSWWCHPTISFSVIPFSSCPQSFPASGSFQMSQLFPSGRAKYWSFSFSISPSNVYSGLISFPVIFKWINIYLLSSNNAIWKFFFTNINPPVSILNILLCNCFFTCTYFHWMFMMINSHCVFMMAKPCPIFQVFLC